MGEKSCKKEFENLEKLNNIRNLFGHASLSVDRVGRAEDIKVFFSDPKHPNVQVDPEEKLAEFNNLFPGVLKWLKNASQQLGVNFS